VTAASGLAVDRFPTADADGSYVYERTFELPAGTVPTDLLDGVVVVHGISELFGDDAAYDGEPRSSINPDLPLEATIPALYGELVEGEVSDPGEARDFADACLSTDIAAAGFTDVDEDNINAVASEAIAVGQGNGRFAPGDPVRRDQMASFLARKLDYLVEQNDLEVPDAVIS
jgi:hypothetical protein